ncbi:pentapeptide repeat-containing protein [Nocardia sp. CDC159]|uniref:Pentapeptide repeat-containing protein n=1 Tax=Nocardia pulmonis TaxID=2951408 RepID=A0A9X2IWZ6_9NOCA|nr:MULTISPECIES: pentapeptide repeat-containing protein [Nocardia]MCM6774099.1 pentapeptide repeat-containing protein [Nocardia pulmonis]MCM6786986.1 pentapeptide repeat-containing protein [Nocardia sp. CDC159]
MWSRGRFGARLSGWMRRSALLLSVLFAVTGGLVIAGAAWWLLWLALGARAETPNQVELTKIALSVAAGVGGAVALVVAYRRQRDSERSRFAELFGAAAKQLGDADVAVRMAGVYAMAGVADEFRAAGRRQQCIDVLCGYLRLPYEPQAGVNHLVGRTETVEGEPKTELRYQFRQNDREVRRAIVDVIVAHLRPSAETSWSDRDFDFAGAVLEDCDFRYAVFAGERTYFARAVFVGARATTFEYAKFTGRYLSFRDAVFEGSTTLFRQTEFAARENGRSERRGRGVKFDGAVFRSPVGFDEAVFRGPQVSFREVGFERRAAFDNARFLARSTNFASAVFAKEYTLFTGARFHGEEVSFERATFEGDRIRFDDTEFASASVVFSGAHFDAAATSFDRAHFGIRSRWRSPVAMHTRFIGTDFHGRISFDNTVFGGRSVDFSGSDFIGEIRFDRAKFTAAAIIFARPKIWSGVSFFWDRDPRLKPANVQPDTWPPTPTDGQ